MSLIIADITVTRTILLHILKLFRFAFVDEERKKDAFIKLKQKLDDFILGMAEYIKLNMKDEWTKLVSKLEVHESKTALDTLRR